MSFNRNILGENSKEDVLELIKSEDFRDIFLENNITNVIVFGSLLTKDFNEESDIDIAIIS
ncbi:nucleotidyltransferase domain-containing protein, partial [Clostridium saudiense]|nr:nucleotidyltransferase domain-containing protein [Clostridium saudiense]